MAARSARRWQASERPAHFYHGVFAFFTFTRPPARSLWAEKMQISDGHTGARRGEHFYSRASLKEGPQVAWIWDGKIALFALLQAREHNFLTSYSNNLGPHLLAWSCL